MQTNSKWFAWRPLRPYRCCLVLLFLAPAFSFGSTAAAAQEEQQSREPGAKLRLPRQQAQTNAALDGVVRSGAAGGGQLSVAGSVLQLQELTSGEGKEYCVNGVGAMRVRALVPCEQAR